METKICVKCGIKKTLDNFYFKKCVNRYETRCNVCVKKYMKEWSKKNKIKIRENKHNYYIKNMEHIKKANKLRNKKKQKEYMKKYYQRNRDYLIKCSLKRYENNKEEINKKHKEYYEKNKKQLMQKAKVYVRNRRTKNPIYKFKCQVRCMLNGAFYRKNFKKNHRVEQILGCDYKTFYNYLLQTFKNNYGYEWDGIEKIHIDHIYPLKYAKTEEEIIKLCHYTNLQLLKAKDNIEKRAKINWTTKKTK